MADDDDRTTPIGLFNFANSYWHSAIALEKAKVEVTHPNAPIYFLYSHAIELYLKSYLRAQGHTVQELRRKFGHNVVKMLDDAKRFGLHFDDEDVEVLNLMVESDSVIGSRFLRTGFSQRPDNKALNRTCESLHQSVGEDLKENGFPVRM